MALIICGDCKKEYSDYAKACPNCARPTTSQEKLFKKLSDEEILKDFFSELTDDESNSLDDLIPNSNKEASEKIDSTRERLYQAATNLDDKFTDSEFNFSKIFQKVRSVVAEKLGLEAGEIKLDSKFQNDLGADSLDIVELMMDLEEAFDIEISDEAAESITTVDEAVKFIEEKKKLEAKDCEWFTKTNEKTTFDNIEVNTNIVFLPRDDDWAYVFWEISLIDREKAKSLGAKEFFLRLYEVSQSDIYRNKVNSGFLREITIDVYSSEWYLPIPCVDRNYKVELGYRVGFSWFSLAFSSTSYVRGGTKSSENKPIYGSLWRRDVDYTRSLLRKHKRFGSVSLEEELSLLRRFQEYKQVERAELQIIELTGNKPTVEELSTKLGFSISKVNERLRDGKTAEERIVAAYLRLVLSVAKEYQSQGFKLFELYKEGINGLLMAMEKFDSTRGYKFSTYAFWWIKQSICKAISKKK